MDKGIHSRLKHLQHLEEPKLQPLQLQHWAFKFLQSVPYPHRAVCKTQQSARHNHTNVKVNQPHGHEPLCLPEIAGWHCLLQSSHSAPLLQGCQQLLHLPLQGHHPASELGSLSTGCIQLPLQRRCVLLLCYGLLLHSSSPLLLLPL